MVDAWNLSPSSHPSSAGETAGPGTEGQSPFTPCLAAPRWLWLPPDSPRLVADGSASPSQSPLLGGPSTSEADLTPGFGGARGSSSRALLCLFIKHLQGQLLCPPEWGGAEAIRGPEWVLTAPVQQGRGNFLESLSWPQLLI